jgi:hypothetical protein
VGKGKNDIIVSVTIVEHWKTSIGGILAFFAPKNGFTLGLILVLDGDEINKSKCDLII